MAKGPETSKGAVDADGMPIMSADERDQNGRKGITFFLVATVVTNVIGFVIALGVYFSSARYAIRVHKLCDEHDLHYAFLAAFIFANLVQFLNMYPTVHKSRVMRGNSGNLRANMYIYQTLATKALVGLVADGDIGKYNRANRSLHHFTEFSSGIVVGLVLLSFVFPAPVLFLTLLLAVGRVWHQIGYTLKGYGAHGLGFALSMIAGKTLDGLLLVAAIKGFCHTAF